MISTGSRSQILLWITAECDEAPYGIYTAEHGKSNKQSSLPKPRTETDPSAQHRAAHSSFKHTPAPKPALMIHISWIKHCQQRHQQVSWTVRIRKALYLRKLQHTASEYSRFLECCVLRPSLKYTSTHVYWMRVLCNYRDWALNQIRAAGDVMHRFGHLSNTTGRPTKHFN